MNRKKSWKVSQSKKKPTTPRWVNESRDLKIHKLWDYRTWISGLHNRQAWWVYDSLKRCSINSVEEIFSRFWVFRWAVWWPVALFELYKGVWWLPWKRLCRQKELLRGGKDVAPSHCLLELGDLLFFRWSKQNPSDFDSFYWKSEELFYCLSAFWLCKLQSAKYRHNDKLMAAKYYLTLISCNVKAHGKLMKLMFSVNSIPSNWVLNQVMKSRCWE